MTPDTLNIDSKKIGLTADSDYTPMDYMNTKRVDPILYVPKGFLAILQREIGVAAWMLFDTNIFKLHGYLLEDIIEE